VRKKDKYVCLYIYEKRNKMSYVSCLKPDEKWLTELKSSKRM